jgi:hypothetical protein
VRKGWADTAGTPLYLLKSFSSSLEEGVPFSLVFMYDCRAISRRRCLSRYRFASRELKAFGHSDTLRERELDRGTYVAPVALTNSLRSLSFLEGRDCRNIDGGDERAGNKIPR